jgi:EAL domain-containing protein (putative c-di-GMP-specific phosphodiesterase class I)
MSSKWRQYMPGVRRIYEWLSEGVTWKQELDTLNNEQEIANFTVRVGNYPHIRKAFGEDAAHDVIDQLVNRINQVLKGDGLASPAFQGKILVRLTKASHLQTGTTPATFQSWLWALCAALSTLPIKAGADVIFPMLWASWGNLPDVEDVGALEPADPWHVDELARVCEVGDGNVAAWAQRYRADMTLAAEVLAAITPREIGKGKEDVRFLLLLWQPVQDARAPSSILYHEALLRFVDRQGVWIAPSQSLLALERLGLIGLLDQHVVSRVIDRLEADPDVRVGVNISARSARCDMWWREIIARLRAAPEVARRLTIEITETAELPDMTSAVRFVDGVKKLGCKVALDDFGVGFTSIRQILALRPDIVKIDGFFMREADLSARGRELFGHLVQVTRSFGATVVVEGVETEAQSQLAVRFGAHWQQGYFWARPAVAKSMQVEAENTPAMSLPSRVQATHMVA